MDAIDILSKVQKQIPYFLFHSKSILGTKCNHADEPDLEHLFVLLCRSIYHN